VFVAVDDSKSGTPKPAESSDDDKPGGGLSASDLRARLGLKSSPKSSDSIRSRLGLNQLTSPKSSFEGSPGALTTNPIEKSLLDALRSHAPVPGGGPPKKPPVAEEPQGRVFENETEDQPQENHTHALSLDEFEDMILESQVSPSIQDADDDDFNAVLDSIGSSVSPVDDDEVEELDDADLEEEDPEPEPQKSAAVFSGESPVVESQPQSAAPAAGRLPHLDLDGEKTSLLDTDALFGEEDEEFDAFPEGDKTQMMVPTMDYDPLSGKLVVEEGEAPQKEFSLPRDKTSIGRGTKNGIVIPDIAMSRKHLTFERFTEGFVVRDEGSGNGTFVNGRRIVYAELRSGDIVEAGNLKFRFEQSGGEPGKLWKGAAKVEFHAKDGTTKPASRSAPAAPVGAVNPALSPSVPQQQAVPQSLLTRPSQPGMPPGGQWGQPAMPGQLGNPYGAPWQPPMGYHPGYTQQGMQQQVQQQRSGSPVVTALIVFFTILLLGLVGLIVWSLAEQTEPAPMAKEEAQEESEESKRKRAAEFVTEGSTLFDQRRWEDARKAFIEALELDPNNTTARMFVEDVIDRERMTEEQITKAMEDIRTSPTAANYEKALQILSLVDQESTFANEVNKQHLPAVKRNYRKLLIREAKKSIEAGNLSKAKRDLTKIQTDLGMEDDSEVRSILLQIEKKKNDGKP